MRSLEGRPVNCLLAQQWASHLRAPPWDTNPPCAHLIQAMLKPSQGTQRAVGTNMQRVVPPVPCLESVSDPGALMPLMKPEEANLLAWKGGKTKIHTISKTKSSLPTAHTGKPEPRTLSHGTLAAGAPWILTHIFLLQCSLLPVRKPLGENRHCALQHSWIVFCLQNNKSSF